MAVDEAASAPGQPEIDETNLVAALRAGDERAFRELVRRHHAALVRLAQASVVSRTLAEGLGQDTWLSVIRGIAGFDARSSLKTWIFRILVDQARTRAAEKCRVAPTHPGDIDDAPAVDPGRFVPEGQRWAGHWSEPPVPWTDLLGTRAISEETVAGAITALPERQRQVVTLRDVEGWSAAEVCTVLGISESNQHALLHRGRSRVRARLDDLLGGKG